MKGDDYIDVDLGAFLTSHREWELMPPSWSRHQMAARRTAKMSELLKMARSPVSIEKLRSSVVGPLNA
jgi:hypothetical protein